MFGSPQSKAVSLLLGLEPGFGGEPSFQGPDERQEEPADPDMSAGGQERLQTSGRTEG